jgi:hypothetical protein
VIDSNWGRSTSTRSGPPSTARITSRSVPLKRTIASSEPSDDTPGQEASSARTWPGSPGRARSMRTDSFDPLRMRRS